MKTIELYKNYGCLTAEKRVIYTYGMPQPTATTSDRITVRIPDGWTADKNAAGVVLLTGPDGKTYEPNEVLSGNEFPALTIYTGPENLKRYRMEVIEEL